MMRKMTEGRANTAQRNGTEAGEASAEGKADCKGLRAGELIVNIKYESALLIKVQRVLLSPLFSYHL